MDPAATLIGEIDSLERIQREIVAISQRTDEERKRELVRLRRLLAEQVGRVSAAGEAVFNTAPDPRLYSEFRSLLSAMRSAIALHQANWPAVALDSADDDYVRSVAAARAARDAFLSWTRAALTEMRQNRG